MSVLFGFGRESDDVVSPCLFLLAVRFELRDLYLQSKKQLEVVQEAKRMRPHFEVLIASDSQKRANRHSKRSRNSQSAMMTSLVVNKSRLEVDTASAEVYGLRDS